VRDGLGPFQSEAEAVAAARASDPEADWTPVRIRSFLASLTPDSGGRLVGKLPVASLPELQAARASGLGVTDALASIAVPTLIFIAVNQSDARIADKLAYAERMPGARVIRLPGTHFLHTDCPADVAAGIAAFAGEDGAPA
jgi:pimeloyl-ACP methyl ester carboxylesterase